MKVPNIFTQTRRWFSNKPYRDLDRAYQSVLSIKAIETNHFAGKKVSNSPGKYSESVMRYFNNEVGQYLKIAEAKLEQFYLHRGNNSNFTPKSEHIYDNIAKIDLIEEYLERYNVKHKKTAVPELAKSYSSSNTNKKSIELQSVSDETGVLPRSFLRTIKRIQQEIDPKSEETEEKVLNKFRSSRYKTAVSIKFFLILIIVPLLTHQVTKTFLIAPLVERYASDNQQLIFINNDFEEEAFRELNSYEERLHFQEIIGLRPELSEAEIDKLVEEKAHEIAKQYQRMGLNALENIFADIFSLLSFGLIIFFSKKEITIVKSFLDDLMYGLSDSAKAFLIILLTDIFVGYHSPHGWEIILEGISKHFGLPENREFNFLFIATFPVILDTVLKYWIFRYLNRISPSAVATYRNMNE